MNKNLNAAVELIARASSELRTLTEREIAREPGTDSVKLLEDLSVEAERLEETARGYARRLS